MTASSTEPADPARERALIRRFRQDPLGVPDPELRAFLLPLRNLPAVGKHALMRLPMQQAWTLVRLGGRNAPVEVVGGCWTSRADAEWAVFRARWQTVHGWDPECVDD
jgi:hypothetical protein